MKAIQQLPANYEQQEKLDLSQNERLLVILNVVGLLLLVLFCYFFMLATTWLRGMSEQLFVFSLANFLLWLITIPSSLIGVVILHELVHGLFFWLFTKERPHFGFKVVYAYAAAPTWYIPRNQFIVIGAAPLILITLVGLALMPSVPNWLLPALLLALTFNAAGAVGDLYIIWWLLSKPASVLIRDVGDAFTIYGPS